MGDLATDHSAFGVDFKNVEEPPIDTNSIKVILILGAVFLIVTAANDIRVNPGGREGGLTTALHQMANRLQPTRLQGETHV